MNINDGLQEFRRVFDDLGIKPIDLVARTARWVDPKTYDRLPVWYPESYRKMPLYKQCWIERSNGNKLETNYKAGYALWQALGVGSSKKFEGKRIENWTVCHIWGFDDPTFQQKSKIVQNPKYYSNIGNMILLPTPIKAFTDALPEVKTMLKICAWHLYGFVCEEEESAEIIKNGEIPPDYPEEWPRIHREKLPPGTVEYDNYPRIGMFIEKRRNEISKALSNPNLLNTNYPRKEVIEVLEAFPGSEQRWWQ